MSDSSPTEGPKNPAKDSSFTFQLMGGIDQAVLLNDYDWQNLDNLDPKLWMALSCPIAGLEFNHECLNLLDTDHDGRIRAQEVKDAVAWVCKRLIHPSQLTKGSTQLRLEELRSDTEEGTDIASALKIVLQQCGKTENDPLELAEIEEALARASGYPFNGDGIITVESAEEAAREDPSCKDVPGFVTQAYAMVGAAKDASGKPGLSDRLCAELVSRLKAVKEWREKVSSLELPLGEKTGDAWAVLQTVRSKLDDFFERCQFLAFAPDTEAALNESGVLKQMAEENAPALNHDALVALPLARINPSAELDLTKDLNPAWQKEMALFGELFAPVLEKPGILTMPVWLKIREKFGEYATTLASKPDFPLPPADAEVFTSPGLPEMRAAPAGDSLDRAWLPATPNQTLDGLTDEQIDNLLATALEFPKVVSIDMAAPSLASFQALYQLGLYNAWLYTFLMNFLSFMDFYNPEKKAIFQTGTLYLDSRGCMLSVPVGDIESHASLSVPSHLCLIYCECTRRELDGAVKTMTIASALTQGNLADLLDGRHGLFIDNDGKEWDTRIIRIIHNPVSLREAVWSPYIRLGNMASQQIQKFVSKKEEEATKAVTDHATAVAQGTPPPAEKGGFDFAKGAGIFAALGVALSAVSAAFAYIANSLASLGWLWPLAIVLVFICISGPSVVLAWLKLRRRSLGPLLDASGWAVNQGAPINLPMGASLTSIGKLPPNASCNSHDPYSLPGKMLARKWKTRFWITVFLILLCVIGAFVLYVWLFGEPLWLFQLRAMTGI